MIEHYLPILIFMLVGIGFGVTPILMGAILGPKDHNEVKLAPFECGFSPFEAARMKFDVRFYLVAILFIIFDLEIAFLFPWAVVLRQLPDIAFWAMMLFLGFLVVGFIYEWKKGALEWE